MMHGSMIQKTDFPNRQATPGDAATLSRLTTDLGYPSTSDETADRLRKTLDTPNHQVMVAESPDHEGFDRRKVAAGGGRGYIG